jgi:hypothetical protein
MELPDQLQVVGLLVVAAVLLDPVMVVELAVSVAEVLVVADLRQEHQEQLTLAVAVAAADGPLMDRQLPVDLVPPESSSFVIVYNHK